MTYIPYVKSSRIEDGTIVNADVAVGAAIALEKIASPVTSFSFNNQLLTNLATPVSGTDAANKDYVDSVAQGLDVKASVRAATTANITLSGTQTIDGVSVIAGDRVLVKNQTAGEENGIYVVAAGAWSRSSDANTSSEVTSGMFTFVEEGTANGDEGWVLTTNNPITLGTTSLTFTQFSSAVFVEELDDLTDVDVTGAVDGALLRYEATGTQWNDTTALLFSDAGQLAVSTTGAGAGILLGGDAQWYRSAADTMRTPDHLVVDLTSTFTGKVTMGAALNTPVSSVKTGAYTVDVAADSLVRVDTTGGAVTITLPASHTSGDEVTIKDVGGDAGLNNITIATADTDQIEGSASDYIMDLDYQSLKLKSDGTNWWIV